MIASVLFYLLAGIALLSAAFTVTRRNPFHSAVFLIITLIAIAGIFLQLHAPFLFLTQLILYAGALTILFILAAIFSTLDIHLYHYKFARRKLVVFFMALALAIQVGLTFYCSRRFPTGNLVVQGSAAPGQLPPTTDEILIAFFRNNPLSIAIICLLLAVSILGARIIATQRKLPE